MDRRYYEVGCYDADAFDSMVLACSKYADIPTYHRHCSDLSKEPVDRYYLGLCEIKIF